MWEALSVVGSSPFASSEVGVKLTWSQVASARGKKGVGVPVSMQNRLDPSKPVVAAVQTTTAKMGLTRQVPVARLQPILIRRC